MIENLFKLETYCRISRNLTGGGRTSTEGGRGGLQSHKTIHWGYDGYWIENLSDTNSPIWLASMWRCSGLHGGRTGPIDRRSFTVSHSLDPKTIYERKKKGQIKGLGVFRGIVFYLGNGNGTHVRLAFTPTAVWFLTLLQEFRPLPLEDRMQKIESRSWKTIG